MSLFSHKSSFLRIDLCEKRDNVLSHYFCDEEYLLKIVQILWGEFDKRNKEVIYYKQAENRIRFSHEFRVGKKIAEIYRFVRKFLRLSI